MNFFESLTSKRTVLWGSMIISAIIIYPNIGDLMWKLFSPVGSWHYTEFSVQHFVYFFYRYFFFVTLTWLLIRVNILKSDKKFSERFWLSFFITMAAYLLYVIVSRSFSYFIRYEVLTQTVILQFLIAWLIPVLIGHVYCLTVVHQEAEKEMEKLRSESLQSRVDALSNQINPHFFFNSLNGLTALVSDKRNDETLEYVAKLSNIFRYILQSDKKGLVRLEEELKFLDAYRYLLEIRYSGKLTFNIHVEPEDKELLLPVLSLLPLVENVVKHNVIDTDHKMTIYLCVTENKELVVGNYIYRKYQVDVSTGIGLSNLAARYKLLVNEEIKIIEEADKFSVVLPLKRPENESSDR